MGNKVITFLLSTAGEASVLETLTDAFGITDIVEIGIFPAAVVTAFGEPFKLLALELSFMDLFEKDESSD